MTHEELAEVGDESTARAAAFRRLADEHLDTAYRLARAIVGDRAEAEDATHDAFVQAWRKWGTLRDAAAFEHWFHRILVNTCRNRIRRVARWRTQDLSPALERSGADVYRQADDRDALGSALARLGPDHRVVVALRYYRDLTVDQIAVHLGISAGTVKSRLHHALRRLERSLVEAEGKEAAR